MFKFATRSAARNFANGRKVVDLGSETTCKRWGVKVLKTSK